MTWKGAQDLANGNNNVCHNPGLPSYPIKEYIFHSDPESLAISQACVSSPSIE